MNMVSNLLCGLVVWTTVAGICGAQTTGCPSPVRDAATHGELAEALRAMQTNDPMGTLPQVEALENIDSPAGPRSRDLVNSSDVLCNLGMATLVPKRAVIYVPKRFENRLRMQPNSQLRTFPEFARFNRTWVRTFEVTPAQAEGKEGINEKFFEKEKRLGQVIVATFHGGPISLLPPKEEGKEPDQPEK